MKKMLFFAALSAIALTSCVNDDSSYEQPQQALTLKFDAPAMKQNRANVMGEITGVEYDKREDFMIFSKVYKGALTGWETATENYFNATGDTAKNEGNDSKYWSTKTVYYWPDIEYNLAFAAYSPAKFTTAPTSIVYNANGLQIEGFKTEADADKQYDFMYSDRVIDRNKTNNGHSSVPLVFHHALSSIVFSTEKEDESIKYEITNLKLHGDFIQQADFNQNIVETTDLTSGVAMWEDFAAATTADFTPSFTSPVEVTTVPTQFTQKESALLLIPQAVPVNAAVTVTYTKTTHPGTPDEKVMTNNATILLSDFAQENGNKINTWEMGKRYVYRIAFGQNKRIYFEPSTTDWIQESTLIHVIQ